MVDEYFLFLHRDLPRQGPGSSRSTRMAMDLLPPREFSHILDIGCGPGMQTLDLAQRFPLSRVTALDKYNVFLGQLEERCVENNVNNILTTQGDMMDLPFKPGSFDMIWSEGAVYIIGFEEGLKEWRRFLAKEGCLVVSELSWITGSRPPLIQAYWDDSYPDMLDIYENIRIIEQTGYNLKGLYILPPEDWYAYYYEPLLKNLKKEQGRPLTEDQMTCLELEFLEIQMHQKYSRYYSYVFYVMEKA